MSSPRHREADVVLRDGSTVHVRPVRAEEAPAVLAFFERLSPESIALRFFCGFPDLDRAVRWATEVDDHHLYGLVATSGADGRVVAHAGWKREPDRPRRAEVAFAIANANAMQHNGLGTILLGQLIEAATQAGVAVLLSAEVLPQNHRMLHLFRDSGFPVTTRTLPWSWSSCQRRERRRRWSASDHATAYQATANDAPAVSGAWGVSCSYTYLAGSGAHSFQWHSACGVRTPASGEAGGTTYIAKRGPGDRSGSESGVRTVGVRPRPADYESLPAVQAVIASAIVAAQVDVSSGGCAPDAPSSPRDH